jgi:predicted alpha/beta hydrolase family esterase
MAGARFLILHGWQGSGPDHWQTWLASGLREAGEDVLYPELPDPDTPVLAAWRDALSSELERLRPGRGVVICHSLACILWLHHAASVRVPIERVLLVAPNSAAAGVPEIASFFPAPLDREAVARAAGVTRLVCADRDEYCPEGADRLYGAPLGLEIDLVPGGGHLNPDAGYGPWPAVEAWAYGAKKGVET